MSGPTLALVDVGSTAIKAAVRAGGEPIWEDERAVATRSDGPRVEHDAAELAATVEELLAAARREARPDGIALACQRSTCLVWDRQGATPRTPALSWQDRREASRVAGLQEHAARIAAKTGLRLSPHYAAPKLAGLLESDPALARSAEAGEVVAGTLDAFLLHRLTGRPATEPACAGRTLLYDLDSDRWDEDLARIFGIPARALPELVPSIGTGLEADGVPVLALLGDQQAALLGHGGAEPGVTAVHFGTGAFVLASTGGELRRGDGLLSAVLAARPAARLFQIEGSINSAGSAVDWAAALTGIGPGSWEERELDPAELPLFLPAFAGLATPWWRPEVRAAIGDLSPQTGADELFAATLCGIAQRVADVVESLRASGVEPRSLRASGRLTRLHALVDLVAELTRTPVEVADQEEAGLVGLEAAARLALGESPAAPAPAAYHAAPGWSPDRRRRERRRWRRFVEALLARAADTDDDN